MAGDPNLYKLEVQRLRQCLKSGNHSADESNALEHLQGFSNLTTVSGPSTKKLYEEGLVTDLKTVIQDEKSSDAETTEALKCLSMSCNYKPSMESIKNDPALLKSMLTCTNHFCVIHFNYYL